MKTKDMYKSLKKIQIKRVDVTGSKPKQVSRKWLLDAPF